jgi:hypothetical protein
LEFYRFVKRDRCEQQGIEFRDHNWTFARKPCSIVKLQD